MGLLLAVWVLGVLVLLFLLVLGLAKISFWLETILMSLKADKLASFKFELLLESFRLGLLSLRLRREPIFFRLVVLSLRLDYEFVLTMFALSSSDVILFLFTSLGLDSVLLSLFEADSTIPSLFEPSSTVPSLFEADSTVPPLFKVNSFEVTSFTTISFTSAPGSLVLDL